MAQFCEKKTTTTAHKIPECIAEKIMLRKLETNPHPIAKELDRYWEEIQPSISENFADLIEPMGRGIFEYILWAMLDDTPYTRGEQTLAGQNVVDDVNRGRQLKGE